MKKLKTAVMAVFLVAGMLAKAQNVSPVDIIKYKARAGDAMAQAQYAQMLMTGQGVEKNEAKAFEWYQKAALAGNADAQVNMGVFCQTGRFGLKKDFAKAAEWYLKASEQGNAYAQFYLARLYENGNGVERDMKKAVELLGQASRGGLAQAQVAYALNLFGGCGVDMDFDEALKWAEEAAAAGESKAVKLVEFLRNSKGDWDKTPKSMLGIEFGKPVEVMANAKKASIVDDGSSVFAYVTPKKAFRKFTATNPFRRIIVLGTISTHRAFRFVWKSEDFSSKTTEDEAVSEFRETCEVIGKRFGGKLHEVPIKGKRTTWDRKAVAIFGFLKVEMFLACRNMTMRVTHAMLETQAREEVDALKADRDGSDAL